jgi:nucleoid-associated protein
MVKCYLKAQKLYRGRDQMPIQITDATIHQLDKSAQSQGDDSVTLKPRETNLPVNDVLKRLCGDLIEMYAKVANSNGTLGVDPLAHKFPVHLKEYSAGTTAFMPFTLTSVRLIAEHMGKAFLANGGYALFLRYKVDDQDLLLVVMLKLKPGAGVDADTLDLTETLNIDLAHLHEAARINLTRWQGDQQPYLTFIKGRSRQSGVSDYFRDALACTSFTDSKHHTEAVLRAARDFVEARADLEPEAKRREMAEMRHRLYECLNGSRNEVPLATVAAAINPSAPEDFLTHVKNNADGNDYHLDDRFTPYRRAYIGLKRVSAKYGTVSLAFDVADVQAERVRYDSNSDSIILTSPSAHLKNAIQEHAPTSDNPA